MHEYYEKNLNKWNKTLTAYMNLICSELNSLTGQSYDVLVQEIWTDYQTHMLESFPYIGGDAASGTKNLTGAYYCDFKLKLSAKPMDYDPPVFTQGNGYK